VRLPEFRKLDIRSFLQQPRTRLGRYPLLLEAVLKRTSEEDADFADIQEVITGIKAILTKINIETGKAENRLKLKNIQEKLKYPKDYNGTVRYFRIFPSFG
jgi:hypothetical protein